MNDENDSRASAAPIGSAIQKTWWINVYEDGRITQTLCRSRTEALNRCTYTQGLPDAIQVEVRLHIVRPNKLLDESHEIHR